MDSADTQKTEGDSMVANGHAPPPVESAEEGGKKRPAPTPAAAPAPKKPQQAALQQQIQKQLQAQLQTQLQAAAARGQQANITPEQIQVSYTRVAHKIAEKK